MLDQPELAFRLHALIGGTPAYQAMCVDRPDSAAEFDDWVVQRLLSPASAMFREGSALLYEEPELGDAALYSAPSVVVPASGPTSPRCSGARTACSHLIIRPFEARLVGRSRARVWEQAADTVESLIHDPHLEDLARSWCTEYAALETLGGLPSRCEPALIACREHKKNHELDLVVSADPPHEKSRILAIGEVKATTWPVSPSCSCSPARASPAT